MPPDQIRWPRTIHFRSKGRKGRKAKFMIVDQTKKQIKKARDLICVTRLSFSAYSSSRARTRLKTYLLNSPASTIKARGFFHQPVSSSVSLATG